MRVAALALAALALGAGAWATLPRDAAGGAPDGAAALAGAMAGLHAAELARTRDSGAPATGPDAVPILAGEDRLPDGMAFEGSAEGAAVRVSSDASGRLTYSLAVRAKWARANCPGLPAAASARGLGATCDVVLDPSARFGQSVVARFVGGPAK